MRASDADRDLAVDILRVATGEGRLTVAELDERLETALTARTINDLVALTADLPAGTMLRPAGQDRRPAGQDRRPPGQDRRAAGQDHDDLAGSRWTSLRSLLGSSPTYRLLPD